MLKKNLLILLCAISAVSPVFAMDQAVRTTPHMDTKSKLTTYQPASLADQASKALFEKFAMSKSELQKAPWGIKERFIRYVLDQYVQESYMIEQDNIFEIDAVKNLPVKIKSEKKDEFELAPGIMLRPQHDDSRLDVIDLAKDEIMQSYYFDDEILCRGRSLENSVIYEYDGICKVIEWDSEKKESSLQTLPGYCFCACVPGQYYVVSNDNENNLHLWEKQGEQVQEVGEVLDYEINLKSSKAIFLLASGDLLVFDKKTGEKSLLPVEGRGELFFDDYSKVVVETDRNSIAVWDIVTGKMLYEFMAIPAGAILESIENEQFVWLKLANGMFQVWDIKNTEAVITLEYNWCCEAFGGRIMIKDDTILKLWDSATKEFTVLGKNLNPMLFTKDCIVATDEDCKLNIWDARSLKLLHKENTMYAWGLELDEEKNQFAWGSCIVPLSLIVPFDKGFNQINADQIQYVFDVLCYIDGVFSGDDELVTTFSTPAFNALPALIQRLTCNYFKAQAIEKNYAWELVDGKEAVYQVTKIVPEPQIQYVDRIEYRDRVHYKAYIPQSPESGVSYSTLLKVGIGAALGLVAYKWFVSNSSE